MINTSHSTCPKCGALIPSEAPQGLCPTCVLKEAETNLNTSQAQGFRSPPPTVEEVDAAFPDLEVLELIGVGGMGAVYKARQSKLGRLIALKILSAKLAESPAFAERFNREGRVLALLNHPNIITVFDFGNQGGFFFMMMEYVDGLNLRQAMQTGKFSPAEALNIVPEICKALQFAHQEGILHRDIKPENILLDMKGRVKIADFGIAKLIGKQKEDITLTTSGAILGTPHYMAPEQLEKPNHVDHRADIYSLGVVFYEMLTGELPIGRFSPPSERRLMDSRVDEVVMRSLEKEPRQRYQSAGEVKTNVEAITQFPETPGTERPPTTNSPTRKISSASGPQSSTTRWATWSASFTGVSLFLQMLLWITFVYRLSTSSQSSEMHWSWLALGFLAIIPALPGLILGILGLRDIRMSRGEKRGLTRCMFGTLAWPLLILIGLVSKCSAMGFIALFGTGLLWLLLATLVTLLAGEIVILTVWRWAKCIPWKKRSQNHPARACKFGNVAAMTAVILLIPTLLILVPWEMFTAIESKQSLPESKPDTLEVDQTPWLRGRPEISFAMTVPAKHVATFALIRSDSFKVIEVLNLKGFVMAADDKPFEGSLQFGSTSGSTSPGRQSNWMIRVEANHGPEGISSGNLPGKWMFDPRKVPVQLNLTAGSFHMLTIAKAAPETTNSRTNETLALRVLTLPRHQPGVAPLKLLTPTIGSGTTNWMETLQKN